MIAWLSDWLRDIIAVILLAVFVELLLPNKAMQRYARLVVGLFILLTILSPILKLMQSDIGAKLDEGMEKWSESAMTREVQMTGLNQITRDAEAMSEKRNLEAAKVTERMLEESIHNELTEKAEAPVSVVDVMLKWVAVSGKQTPYISQVTVTLEADEKKNGITKEDPSVEAVQPVVIEVEIEPMEDFGPLPGSSDAAGDKEGSEQLEQTKGKWSKADPAAAAAITSLITKGWGIDADQIVIRQLAEQRTTR